MALRPAYGFVPYGFRGLPAAPYGYGFGAAPGEMLPEDFDASLTETVVTPGRPKRKGVSRKPGRTAKCRFVLVPQKNGKKVKRKLCWDKHGVLTSNTRAGARGGKGKNARKVVCKRKCKNGGKAVCIGGYRKVKGKRVCKKFVCRKAA